METRNYLRNLVLLAGAALLPVGAFAAPLDSSKVTKTETVKYSVPQAQTIEGAADLYRKLNDAAENVCTTPEDNDALIFYTTDSYQSCYTKALRTAVQKVNIASVTALYYANKANGRVAGNLKPVTDEPEVVASR